MHDTKISALYDIGKESQTELAEMIAQVHLTCLFVKNMEVVKICFYTDGALGKSFESFIAQKRIESLSVK